MASPRQSVLNPRHIALGSSLVGDWNDMEIPWQYDQDLNKEHYAVRNIAGLFDVSCVKKVRITGDDALKVVDHVCTRDMTKISQGQSTYALILNEQGRITDDCIIFHIAENNFLLVHGSGTAMEQLHKSAKNHNVEIELDEDLHTISLQGPFAVDFLNQHTPCELSRLAYFHHIFTTLFNRPCMISRTGYSGERGYEIFAKADDIVPLWDDILKHGRPNGVLPCSINCIEMIRIESGLLDYPLEMNEDDTPWDVGQGLAVTTKKKADYRGKTECLTTMGLETKAIWGLIVNNDQSVEEGADVFDGDNKVGIVTASCFSTIMNQSIALIRTKIEYAKPGIDLKVEGQNFSYTAITGSMPLFDPDKKRRS